MSSFLETVNSELPEIKQEDIDAFRIETIKLIEENKKSPANVVLRNTSIKNSLRYLKSLPEHAHWWSDKNNYSIALHSLQIFLLDSNLRPIWYSTTLENHLRMCFHCIKPYYTAKLELHLILKNKLNFDKITIDTIFNNFRIWDYTRLIKVLAPAADTFDEMLKSPSTIKIDRTWLNALYDVLCCPTLLQEHELDVAFRRIFFGLQKSEKNLKLNTAIIPGILSFLFSEEKECKIWAQKQILERKSKITEAEFDSSLMATFNQLMSYTISKKDDEQYLSLFWDGINTLLKMVEPAVVTNNFCNNSIDLVRFLSDCVIALPSQSFPYILSCFAFLLKLTGSNFWEFAAPYIPQNFIDSIFSNPIFDKFFTTDSLNEDYYNMFMGWVPPFLASLRTSQVSNIISTLLHKLFIQYQKPMYTSSTHEYCAKLGLKCLLEYLKSTKENFRSENDVSLIILKNSRDLAENYTYFIIKYSINNSANSPAYSIATSLLSLCIEIDIILFVSITHELISGKEVMTIPAVYNDFWTSMRKSISYDAEDAAILIIKNLTYAGFLEPLPFIKEKQNPTSNASSNGNVHTNENFVKKFNSLNEQFIMQISSTLMKIFDFSPALLKKIINNRSCAKALILTSSSPFSNLFNSSLDLFKVAFDVEGRLEAIREYLNLDITVGLSVINLAICACSANASFGPFPKMVRISMDIIDALFNTRTGLLNTLPSNFDKKDFSHVLESLWNSLWQMISIICVQALEWAKIYLKDSMIDFTRDVLDLCVSLDKNLPILQDTLTLTSCDNDSDKFSNKPCKEKDDPLTNENIVTTEYQKKDTEVLRRLLKSYCAPFGSISRWLKLNDQVLLYSCVNLVCSMLNKLADNKIDLPDEVLDDVYKLVQKYKKRYRNLSVEQCDEILACLSKFDYISTKIIAAQIKETDIEEDTEIISQNKQPIQIDLTDWVKKDNTNSPISNFTHSNKYPLSSASYSSSSKSQPKITGFIKEGNTDYLSGKREISQPKPSLISSIRADSLEQKRKFAGMAPPFSKSKKNTNDSFENVHPARPPGFRVRMVDRTEAGTKASKPININHNHSDSSSSESDEENDGIFALSRGSSSISGTSKYSKPISRPKVIEIGSSSSRRNNRLIDFSDSQIRAMNLEKRFSVSSKPLLKKILSWDYHNDSAFPSGLSSSSLKTIPSKFSSTTQYLEVFEPLLMLECWQGLLRSKAEDAEKPFKVTIGSRLTVDEFVDLNISTEMSILKKYKITDADIILLYYVPPGQGNVLEQTMPSTSFPSCLSRVLTIKRPNAEFADIVLRTYIPRNMGPYLLPRAELHALRVMSMTTIEREFLALHALPFYELNEQILSATPTRKLKSDPKTIEKLQKVHRVNEPQASAIAGACENEGFILIQGPPGTGKTKTILGIVGTTLSTSKTKAIPISRPGMDLSKAKSINKPQTPSQQPQNKQVLICAPSNAAVDEILIRLKAGIYDSDGKFFIPKSVRLGRSDAISEDVKELCLENLIDKEMESLDEMAGSQISTTRQEHSKVIEKRDELRNTLANSKDLSAQEIIKIQEQLYDLTKQKADLGRKLDEERDLRVTENRKKDFERRQTQQRVLLDAQVICSTLSGSSNEILISLKTQFDTVIIDEACQSIELSALIPLKYGATRCVMVGDPNQLPPTVLSQTAAKYIYDQSLFVRMQKNNPSAVHLLSIQYRMHPEISLFPSKEFYNSELIDGPNLDFRTTRPWHGTKMFSAYRFFDVEGFERVSSRTFSTYNTTEASTILYLYDKLVTSMPSIDFDGLVGIVSPYKQQIFELKDLFKQKYGSSIFKAVTFNTIDGFQGQEKEIIILSCVRSKGNNKSNGVGFLSDIRRMNVSLTRAKCSMWIIGDATQLSSRDPVWNNLVKNAQTRNLITKTRRGFLDQLEIKLITMQSDGQIVNNNITRPETSQIEIVKEKNKTSNRVDVPKPLEGTKKTSTRKKDTGPPEMLELFSPMDLKEDRLKNKKKHLMFRKPPIPSGGNPPSDKGLDNAKPITDGIMSSVTLEKNNTNPDHKISNQNTNQNSYNNKTVTPALPDTTASNKNQSAEKNLSSSKSVANKNYLHSNSKTSISLRNKDVVTKPVTISRPGNNNLSTQDSPPSFLKPGVYSSPNDYSIKKNVSTTLESSDLNHSLGSHKRKDYTLDKNSLKKRKFSDILSEVEPKKSNFSNSNSNNLKSKDMDSGESNNSNVPENLRSTSQDTMSPLSDFDPRKVNKNRINYDNTSFGNDSSLRRPRYNEPERSNTSYGQMSARDVSNSYTGSSGYNRQAIKSTSSNSTSESVRSNSNYPVPQQRFNKTYRNSDIACNASAEKIYPSSNAHVNYNSSPNSSFNRNGSNQDSRQNTYNQSNKSKFTSGNYNGSSNRGRGTYSGNNSTRGSNSYYGSNSYRGNKYYNEQNKYNGNSDFNHNTNSTRGSYSSNSRTYNKRGNSNIFVPRKPYSK